MQYLPLLLLLAGFVTANSGSDDYDDDQLSLIQSAADRRLNASLYWGTYRPNVYFGVRSRSPFGLSLGIAWFAIDDYQSWQNIRNFCEMGDQLDSIDYQFHDGRQFAEQLVEDPANGVALRLLFIKRPSPTDERGEWSVRLSVERVGLQDREISLLVYANTMDPDGEMGTARRRLQHSQSTVEGETSDLGRFHLNIIPRPNNKTIDTNDDVETATLTARLAEEQSFRIKEIVQAMLRARIEQLLQSDPNAAQNPPPPQQLFMLSDHQQQSPNEQPNFYLQQLRLKVPFSLDIHFSFGNDKIIERDVDVFEQQEISNKKRQFEDRFNRRFPLTAPYATKEHRQFGRVLLSNLVGGIGYFYGKSIVDQASAPSAAASAEQPDFFDDEDDELESLLRGTTTTTTTTEDGDDDDDKDNDKEKALNAENKKIKPAEVGPFQLFSGSPSRSFFPRGFLWDEGFHQTLLMSWDPQLSLTIIKSWLALQDENGWIAREQILGLEARSRVPPEFQVQSQNYANPPTLILPLLSLVRSILQNTDNDNNNNDNNNDDDSSDGILDGWEIKAVQSELNIQTTTADEAVLSSPQMKRQLTLLTIRQQIFPRLAKHFQWMRATQTAPLPSKWRSSAQRRELFRWQGRTATHCLTSGMDDYPRPPLNDEQFVEFHVDLQSWMAFYARSLATIGEAAGMADSIVVEYRQLADRYTQDLNELFWDESKNAYGDLTVDAASGSVTHHVHYGYMTLLPLCLGLITDASRLEHTLDLMQSPQHLWSEFGLRSLSTADEYYGRGENYWRGPIWINMNFLALRALHLYYRQPTAPHLLFPISAELSSQVDRVYQQLRRNVVDNVYGEYRRTGFLWEQYNCTTGNGQRSHPFAGWTTLVLNVMAEKY